MIFPFEGMEIDGFGFRTQPLLLASTPSCLEKSKWGFSDAVPWHRLDVLMGHACCPAARDTIIWADLSPFPLRSGGHGARKGAIGFPFMNHAEPTFDL